jgi:hypothetical protein
MIRIDQSADPNIHRTASRIASRLVFLIQPLLRHGDRDDALEKAYMLVREEMEAARKGES